MADRKYSDAKAEQAPPKDPIGGGKNMGIRETSLNSTMKDLGDARTMGPMKAARLVSPTREAKNFRWNIRKL